MKNIEHIPPPRYTMSPPRFITHHTAGCWFTSPQMPQRQGPYEAFKPYVQGVAGRYGNDTRVQWIGIYNEPHSNQPNPKGSEFSSCQLRTLSRQWVDELYPKAMVRAMHCAPLRRGIVAT